MRHLRAHWKKYAAAAIVAGAGAAAAHYGLDADQAREYAAELLKAFGQ